MPKGIPNKPPLKVFRYDAGRFEFMCADLNGTKAAARMGVPKTYAKRADLAEKDLESAAVRLAIKFPGTIWIRKQLHGQFHGYWEYYAGDKPTLPCVELVINHGRSVTRIPLDYLTVYGSASGHLSEKEKRDRWLDEMAWTELKKSGAVRYNLSVTD